VYFSRFLAFAAGPTSSAQGAGSYVKGVLDALLAAVPFSTAAAADPQLRPMVRLGAY